MAGPAHELHASLVVLDNRGAVVHPVAAIDIDDALDALDDGRMDVAADHAVEAQALDVVHDALLEVADEGNCQLNLKVGATLRNRNVGRLLGITFDAGTGERAPNITPSGAQPRCDTAIASVTCSVHPGVYAPGR
jgi:hypothetical protein